MFPRLIIISALTASVAAFSTPPIRTAMLSRLPINQQLPFRHPSPCFATVPKSEEISSSDNTKPLTSSPPSVASKLRQLKDRMWVREALEDLTAAEFASSLTVEDTRATSSSTGENQSSRKRAVDFENVLNKLDARIEEMCVVTSEEISKQMDQTCHIIERRIPGSEGNTTTQNMCYALAENIGMGSVVYNTEQREALLKRLIATRGRLISFMEGSEMNGVEGGVGGEGMGAIDDIRSKLSEDYSTTIGQQPDSSNGASKSTFDPSLYVRDDGTIDWDGALQDREALKKFGSAVWSRINGQDPENNAMEGQDLMSPGDEFHAQNKVVTAKIEDTDAIRKKRDQLEREKRELQRLEIEHTKLLNSAISAGQAVANVNFATINPSLRLQIRASSDELDAKAGEVTFHTLNYELERIYTYLDAELGNTATKGYIPLQDRLNVAEFGLLESQVESFNRQMEIGESLDSDVLAVVADQLTDFKRRLGIDYYVTGLTFDSEAIQVWLKDIGAKTKKGLVFYVKGTRLFGDDIVFCLSLIGRALQGYTLKPREVRTLRRTIKDTITFIPVVIILLIPLTPIGHVLVFGAIQRVFPDFFPSCFTERRQNLLELYESTEYSAVTIDETLSQQLIRISQAIGFSAAQMGTQVFATMGISEEPKEASKIENDPKA
mmetsp:Transcript_28809/g.49021  ORF Transcript_28809/g.49021 Transcript_28809/m.49021 type:complete len:664 (-) Transcript_28809:113-2104(-)